MPVALGGLALADILTLLAWAICLGLVLVWKHTIGRGIIWVADELDKASTNLGGLIPTVHIFGPLTSALRWIENSVATWLGEAALATEHATLFLWNHTVSIVEEIAKWVEDEALTELHAWESLFTVTLPRYFHSLTGHVEQLIHAGEADARKAEAALQRTATREIARVETKADTIIHHAEAVISADVLPRIRTAEHDLEILKNKLEDLSKRFSKAGIVALIGATIWKELFGGTRCSSWDNLIKNRGCSTWSDLENLLGLVVVTGLALDLPALIGEAQSVTPGIIDGIEKLAGLKS